MDTPYEKVFKELIETRCDTCAGAGTCDDAEPGDIMYNEWVCKSCKGSGFKDSQMQLRVKLVL